MIWLLLAGCPAPDDCVTDAAFFEDRISPLLQQDCIVCHVAGGAAGETRNVLLPASDPGHLEANFAVLTALAAEDAGGISLLLAKPSGLVSHGGGTRFAPESETFLDLHAFVARAASPGGCEHPGDPPPTCAPGQLTPGEQPLRRLTDQQYANAVEDLLGVRPDGQHFPATESTEGYSTWAAANPMSSAGVEGVLLAAESVSRAATADLDGLLACTEAETSEACTTRFLDDFLYRAFRRPLTEEETATFATLTAAGGEDAVGMVIEAALISPQFLYLDSTGADTVSDDVQHLTDYAIASRLSFFLWNTTPPDPLLAVAAEGALHTRDQVRAQAEAMVQDPRALATVAAFHQDWLRTWQLDTIAKDADAYPSFGPELVSEMKQEVDLFTTEVMWLGDGTLDTLLYSPVSWTTPALDTLYGTSDARTGEGWERRSLDPAERPGVLGKAAFLSAHAYSQTSSPVRRGTFVMEQLLCTDLTPPPGIDLDLPEPTETNTIRDRLAEHRANPACAHCHDQIDPLGFSMEHYGALGEYRTVYANGQPVDASDTFDGETFDGVLEMLQTIDHQAVVRDCYASHWFRYGAGRGETLTDRCSVDRLGARFAYTGGDIRDLLVAVATSDPFLYRHAAVLEDP